MGDSDSYWTTLFQDQLGEISSRPAPIIEHVRSVYAPLNTSLLSLNLYSSQQVFITIFWLDEKRAIPRIRQLFKARLLVNQLQKSIAQQNGQMLGKFGVYPGMSQPTMVFELGTEAATYTESELISNSSSGITKSVYGLLRKILGWHQSIGAVIVVGKKQ